MKMQRRNAGTLSLPLRLRSGAGVRMTNKKQIFCGNDKQRGMTNKREADDLLGWAAGSDGDTHAIELAAGLGGFGRGGEACDEGAQLGDASLALAGL